MDHENLMMSTMQEDSGCEAFCITGCLAGCATMGCMETAFVGTILAAYGYGTGFTAISFTDNKK